MENAAESCERRQKILNRLSDCGAFKKTLENQSGLDICGTIGGVVQIALYMKIGAGQHINPFLVIVPILSGLINGIHGSQIMKELWRYQYEKTRLRRIQADLGRQLLLHQLCSLNHATR